MSPRFVALATWLFLVCACVAQNDLRVSPLSHCPSRQFVVVLSADPVSTVFALPITNATAQFSRTECKILTKQVGNDTVPVGYSSTGPPQLLCIVENVGAEDTFLPGARSSYTNPDLGVALETLQAHDVALDARNFVAAAAARDEANWVKVPIMLYNTTSMQRYPAPNATLRLESIPHVQNRIVTEAWIDGQAEVINTILPNEFSQEYFLSESVENITFTFQNDFFIQARPIEEDLTLMKLQVSVRSGVHPLDTTRPQACLSFESTALCTRGVFNTETGLYDIAFSMDYPFLNSTETRFVSLTLSRYNPSGAPVNETAQVMLFVDAVVSLDCPMTGEYDLEYEPPVPAVTEKLNKIPACVNFVNTYQFRLAQAAEVVQFRRDIVRVLYRTSTFPPREYECDILEDDGLYATELRSLTCTVNVTEQVAGAFYQVSRLGFEQLVDVDKTTFYEGGNWIGTLNRQQWFVIDRFEEILDVGPSTSFNATLVPGRTGLEDSHFLLDQYITDLVHEVTIAYDATNIYFSAFIMQNPEDPTIPELCIQFDGQNSTLWTCSDVPQSELDGMRGYEVNATRDFLDPAQSITVYVRRQRPIPAVDVTWPFIVLSPTVSGDCGGRQSMTNFPTAPRTVPPGIVEAVPLWGCSSAVSNGEWNIDILVDSSFDIIGAARVVLARIVTNVATFVCGAKQGNFGVDLTGGTLAACFIEAELLPGIDGQFELVSFFGSISSKRLLYFDPSNGGELAVVSSIEDAEVWDVDQNLVRTEPEPDTTRLECASAQNVTFEYNSTATNASLPTTGPTCEAWTLDDATTARLFSDLGNVTAANDTRLNVSCSQSCVTVDNGTVSSSAVCQYSVCRNVTVVSTFVPQNNSNYVQIFGDRVDLESGEAEYYYWLRENAWRTFVDVTSVLERDDKTELIYVSAEAYSSPYDWTVPQLCVYALREGSSSPLVNCTVGNTTLPVGPFSRLPPASPELARPYKFQLELVLDLPQARYTKMQIGFSRSLEDGLFTRHGQDTEGAMLRPMLFTAVNMFENCFTGSIQRPQFTWNSDVLQPVPLASIGRPVYCNEETKQFDFLPLLQGVPPQAFESDGIHRPFSVSLLVRPFTDLELVEPVPVECSSDQLSVDNGTLVCVSPPTELSGQIASVVYRTPFLEQHVDDFMVREASTTLFRGETNERGVEVFLEQRDSVNLLAIARADDWTTFDAEGRSVPGLRRELHSSGAPYFIFPDSTRPVGMRQTVYKQRPGSYFVNAIAAFNDEGAPSVCMRVDGPRPQEHCSVGTRRSADSEYYDLRAEVDFFATSNITVSFLRNITTEKNVSTKLDSLSLKPAHILLADITLSFACEETSVTPLALDPQLPSTRSVTPRVACPNDTTTIVVEASAPYDLSYATIPQLLLENGTQCSNQVVQGNQVQCDVLRVQPGTIEVEQENRLGKKGADNYILDVSFVDETDNWNRPATEWIKVNRRGERLPDSAARNVPATSLSQGFMEMASEVFLVELRVPMTYVPPRIYLKTHLAKSAGDPTALELCVRYYINGTQIDTAACSLYNGFLVPSATMTTDPQSVRFMDRMLPLEWELRIQLRRVLFDPAQPEENLWKPWRAYDMLYTDTGRCSFSSRPSTTREPVEDTPSRITQAFPVVKTCVKEGSVFDFSISTNLFRPSVGRYVDWEATQRSVGSTVGLSDDEIPDVVPWIPRVTVAGLHCHLSGFNYQTSTLFCNLTAPVRQTEGPIELLVQNKLHRAPLPFKYTECFPPEAKVAQLSQDLTTGTTFFAFSVGLISTGLVATQSVVSGGSAFRERQRAGPGKLINADIFRFVYYMQFVSAMGQTQKLGEYPQSASAFASDYGFTNGFYKLPWHDCLDINSGRNLTLVAPLEQRDRCDVDPEFLFESTLFWQFLMATSVVLLVKLFTVLVVKMWHRVPAVRKYVDVGTLANLPLIPYVLVVRLLLLASNGMTMAVVFQLAEYSENVGATVGAVIMLIVYTAGFPLLTWLVITRFTESNAQLAETTLSKAMFAFGGLFAEYKDNMRYTALVFLLKRTLQAIFLGALTNDLATQLFLMLGVNVVYTSWVHYRRPFFFDGEHKLHIFMQIAESVFIFFHLLFVETDEVLLISVAMLCTAAVSIVFLVLMVRYWMKRKRYISKIKKRIGIDENQIDETAFDIEDKDAQKAVAGTQSADFGKKSESRADLLKGSTSNGKSKNKSSKKRKSSKKPKKSAKSKSTPKKKKKKSKASKKKQDEDAVVIDVGEGTKAARPESVELLDVSGQSRSGETEMNTPSGSVSGMSSGDESDSLTESLPPVDMTRRTIRASASRLAMSRKGSRRRGGKGTGMSSSMSFKDLAKTRAAEREQIMQRQSSLSRKSFGRRKPRG